MITLEIDYYAREDSGHPYHVKTTRMNVPKDYDPKMIPFLLTNHLGHAHYGIRKATVISG